MLPVLGLKAQNNTKLNGIYLTENDYKIGKLSYILGSHDNLLSL